MTGSSGYTDGELLRMQQDAIARVKEMQERARASVTAQEGWTGSPPPSQEGTGEKEPPAPEPKPADPPGEKAAAPAPAPAPSPGREEAASPLEGLLGGARSPFRGLVQLLGGDRLLILGLLVLLLGEETEPPLLLALFYLLLFD